VTLVHIHVADVGVLLLRIRLVGRYLIDWRKWLLAKPQCLRLPYLRLLLLVDFLDLDVFVDKVLDVLIGPIQFDVVSEELVAVDKTF
jgi:hypothetical protein